MTGCERKKGALSKDSWNAYLTGMAPGGRRFIETTLESYPTAMHTINTPKFRRPAAMSGMEFSTTLFTAVCASKAGDVRYLICLERAA